MSRADFVEETTTSIAGTSGDGAVTLTAITNTPRFSTVFGSAARMVEYVIEDTVAKKFETGYGSVSSNVLTRTTPRSTWNASSFDDTTPAALQFGSSPTSGDIRIRISCLSASFAPSLPALQKTVGSDDWLGYQTPQQINSTASPSAVALVNGREYYVPYLSMVQGSFDAFVINLSVAGSTGIKMAIYEVGADGLPGTCISQSNTISNASSGMKVDSTGGTWGVNTGPIRLAPGWYYIGFICGDSTCQASKWPAQNAGVVVVPTPLGRGVYGLLTSIHRTGSYASGMPSGVPGGSYSVNFYDAWCVALRFNN